VSHRLAGGSVSCRWAGGDASRRSGGRGYRPAL